MIDDLIDHLIPNARRARAGRDIIGRSIVVVGADDEASFWRDRLTAYRITSERGRRGNLLGTLAAYDEVFGPAPTNTDLAQVDQLTMLVGSGTRLEPFTQALGGMKSAFPLPDPAEPAGRYTIGEAAIRSTAPLVDNLRSGGFMGLVVRWGDEVIVPSTPSDVDRRFADCDVVRFGYHAQLTAELARHKEWLLVEPDGTVTRNIERQSLESLRTAIKAHPTDDATACVNLGSFAISHEFLQVAVEVFETYWRDSAVSANWDPYFWTAYQSNAVEWREFEAAKTKADDPAYAVFKASFPDFHERVMEIKRRLTSTRGRPPRIGFLDFGTPYWLDVGTHIALRRMLGEIFADDRSGQALRTLLGLPEQLANGESLLVGASLAPGVQVSNSLILGAVITDPGSTLDRAVVLGGDYGLLIVTAGGTAIECTSPRLTVHGPHGIGLRIRGTREVAGQHSVTTRVGPTADPPISDHLNSLTWTDLNN